MIDVEGSTAVAAECSFCLKNGQEVDILIKREDDVHICDECVALCAGIVKRARKRTRNWFGIRNMSDREGDSDDVAECSFCFKNGQDVEQLIVGQNDAYICDECVVICTGIIKRA